jgi:hypothetical protein
MMRLRSKNVLMETDLITSCVQMLDDERIMRCFTVEL